jgi:hypothetical protein
VELIEPAGPALSMLRQSTARTMPSTSACGLARPDRPAICRTEVVLDDMPSGVKIRSRMKSSHVVLATCATSWPAVMYMMFW